MKRLRPLLSVFLVGCGILASGDTESPKDLPVVDDRGPFDPREAVDDDDQAGAEQLLTKEDAIDEPPFADSEPAKESAHPDPSDEGDPAAAPEEEPSTGGADAAANGSAPPAEEKPADEKPAEEPAAPEKTAGEEKREPPPEPDFENQPEGEHVASPEEVAKLVEERRERMEEIRESSPDDAKAKVELARNPPPEDPGEGEPMVWTLADVFLESLLVAAASAAIAAAWTFGHRFPKTSLAALVLLVVLAVWVVTQLG